MNRANHPRPAQRRDGTTRVLVADDDPVTRRLTQAALARAGHEVVVADDGVEAWRALQEPHPPAVAVLDWVMPGLHGIDLCRWIRGQDTPVPIYLILLTSRDMVEDVVAGLNAGADDYVAKPFHPEELRARVDVGLRLVTLQQALADRVRELEDALARVGQLEGLLPICAWCKKIRDDHNYWQEIEKYVSERSAARFTHGICPGCRANVRVPGGPAS